MTPTHPASARRRKHALPLPAHLPDRSKRRHRPSFSLPIALFASLAITLTTCLLLLLISALLLTRVADPAPLLLPIALSTTALGALLGSILTTRLHPHPHRPLLTAGAFLLCYGAAILILSLMMRG